MTWIEDFLQQVSDIKYDITFFTSEMNSEKILSNHPARFLPPNYIWINEPVWMVLDVLTQQQILLHEVGHSKDGKYFENNKVQREFCAQRWAMNKAKSMKLHELHNSIKKSFGMWEYLFEWKSEYRRYILASKLAKRKGII